MKMEKISNNISYNEATRSNTAEELGINNEPDAEQLQNMVMVAETCFQPAREHFNVPMRINSFFRSPALNHAIGGSRKSQHCKGEAIDISCKAVSNVILGDWIMNNLPFDQLIFEDFNPETQDYKWIHVSYTDKRANRFQCLEMYKENGKSKYRPY